MKLRLIMFIWVHLKLSFNKWELIINQKLLPLTNVFPTSRPIPRLQLQPSPTEFQPRWKTYPHLLCLKPQTNHRHHQPTTARPQPTRTHHSPKKRTGKIHRNHPESHLGRNQQTERSALTKIIGLVCARTMFKNQKKKPVAFNAHAQPKRKNGQPNVYVQDTLPQERVGNQPDQRENSRSKVPDLIEV